ncbi:MAG TPA: TetR/AcrR family transcriptional regulator [Acidimicrobiales bacterium]|jgi:AcrR family transcriptional regulator
MSSEISSVGPARGRPRSDQVDQSILRAASALLSERGLDAMTIEDVAARAGVGKSSIYRRWPTKGTLALDAFLVDFLTQQPAVDTGVLEDDLREALTLWAGAVVGTPTGRALVGLIAEAQDDEDLARGWIERVMTPVRDQHRTMVDRAIQRGEIPVDTDVDVIMDLLYGAAYHRLLQGHLEVTPQFIELVARMVAQGARVGGAVATS